MPDLFLQGPGADMYQSDDIVFRTLFWGPNLACDMLDCPMSHGEVVQGFLEQQLELLCRSSTQ
jgi:hypothetical protein